MTDPLHDAVTHWGLIFHNPGAHRRSRVQWARIAHAIAAADRQLHIGGRADGRIRGDAQWCELAIDTHTALNDALAYRRYDEHREGKCVADATLIRAWLDAPWIPVEDVPRTVAQVAGLDATFAPHHRPGPAAVVDLVAAAQDAGVFGIDLHQVQAWLCPGFPPALVVTVKPPDGPSRCTHSISLTRLCPAADEPVAAIVDVLQAVASEVNHLLAPGEDYARPPPLGPGLEGFPIGQRHRGFVPLQQHAESSAGPRAQPEVRPHTRSEGAHRG